MLAELLAMRADLAKSIDHACQAAAGGGEGNGELVSKKEYDEVKADNKKLRYRITHLLRTLDAQDGGTGNNSSVSGGNGMKLYTTSANFSNLVNQCRITADMTGSSLQVIVVDEETRNSKPHQKLNPTGRYPLLETKDGSLAGVISICKFLTR